MLQDLFPMLSAQRLVQRLYPYESMLGKEGRDAVESVLGVSLFVVTWLLGLPPLHFGHVNLGMAVVESRFMNFIGSAGLKS